MKNRNTSLKCTWKNAVIWSVVTAVAGLLYRYAVLWFCVPAQMVVNDGGVETIINFTSDYFTMCMTLLLPCVFIPIGAYLWCSCPHGWTIMNATENNVPFSDSSQVADLPRPGIVSQTLVVTFP